MSVRDDAIQAAGQIFAMARAKRDSLSSRDAAEAAWYPGHPLKTVDAIEALVVEQRERAEARRRIAESTASPAS